MALNPDLLNNEDFEKVDHDPYQDENVTSTSLTGEMAEEDRYEGNTGDLLGDEYTSTAGQPAYREEPEQLISFDSTPHPEPSAPIPETTVTEPTPPPVPSSRVEPFPEPTAAPTGGLMDIPAFEAMGAWLENVDPRDDSSNAVEGNDDMMASPDNPDDFEKPVPFSGDLEVDGDIRLFTEAGRILKQTENDSDSDSSMSLDGSSGSSDNELSDSESDSEVSVSDTEENKVEKNNIDNVDKNEEEVLGAVGGIDKDILVENDAAGVAVLEYGDIKDGLNENILNRNKHSEEDIIAAINEEVNNAYLIEQQQEDVRSKYFQDLSVDFPHFEMDKAMENKFEGQENSEVTAMEVCSPVKQAPGEIYVQTDEKAMNSNLFSDDKSHPPYFEDDSSGSVLALEKQSENSYEEEDTLVQSDSTGNTSLYTNPSINIPGLNLHEISQRDLVTETDSQAGSSYDPDMMEKIRLGILKNESRLSDEIGSDHSSDVERSSNHSGDHHVRFKDEVVVMEYSDEEKDEKEEIKPDAVEKLKDWLASENEGNMEQEESELNPVDKLKDWLESESRYTDNDTVIEKDSTDVKENNENMMLAMGYSDGTVDRSALDLKFYKIGGAGESPVENDENLGKTVEYEPFPSFYPAAGKAALDEKERTRQLLEIYDSLNVDSENETRKDGEKADLQSEVQNEAYAGSDSDSDEKRSDDESASDSDSDINVSGEWNLSPLCDAGLNDNPFSGIVSEIPESENTNEQESVSSDNICLLNYAPISEDTNNPESSLVFDKEPSQMIGTVSNLMEEMEDKSGIVQEQVPKHDEILESVEHETEGEETNIMSIEEQLKEVENTARQMSEAVEAPAEASTLNMGKETEQMNLEAGAEATFDDEAKDYRTEKNHAIVEEAVTLLDNVEKELEHIIDDIDHTPKLKEGSDSLELEIIEDINRGDNDAESNAENLNDQFPKIDTGNMTMNTESIGSEDAPKLSETSDVADDIQLEVQGSMPSITKDYGSTKVDLETENLAENIVSEAYNEALKSFETVENDSQLADEGKIQLETKEDTSGKIQDTENNEVELETERRAKTVEIVEYKDTIKSIQTVNNVSREAETQKDVSNETEDKNVTKIGLEAKSFKIVSFENPVVSQIEDNENLKIKPVVEINKENLVPDKDEKVSEVSGDQRVTNEEEQVRAEPRDIVMRSSRITKLIVQVVDLIYWRDVKRTGIVFGSMMFVLMALACFSLISVLAYMSIAVLTVTFSFRAYRSIMGAVQKTNEGHPFKKLMEMNIELKDEVVQEAAENIAKHINNCHRELRRLYLVEDYVDSIKFGMLLWLLTYVGSWFSGMTLIMLVVVSIFTLPRVYETYKVQIDTYINMARAQLNKILAQISAKIPFPKKKAKVQ